MGLFIMEECLFCKIISGDIPAHRVFEDEAMMVFLDIHPVNPGHVLFVSKAHYHDFLDAPAEIVANIATRVQRLAPVVLAAVGSTSWNLLVNTGASAGQLVPHLHWHLIPRFPKDGFLHWQGKPDYAQELPLVAEKIRTALEIF